MHSGRKVCKMWWDGSWMQTKTQIPTKLLLFGPCTMFLEICMQINSVVFALSRQINKQNLCENNLLCAGNKVFVTYRTQGERFKTCVWGFEPYRTQLGGFKPPCVRPCTTDGNPKLCYYKPNGQSYRLRRRGRDIIEGKSEWQQTCITFL